MIHINRAIGLENSTAHILDALLVYVSDPALEATTADPTKFIKLKASGSDSPVTYTIPMGATAEFTTSSEGRHFSFAPFEINLNLMDLIQGEMTTVEISTSGAGNYAIIVS